VTADEINQYLMKTLPLPFRGGVLIESDAPIPDLSTSLSTSTASNRRRRKRDL